MKHEDQSVSSQASADILVVDDEQWNRELMESMLNPLGYRIHLALDGREALEKCAEIYPDAILLDLIMPGLDGFEVAHRLKNDPRYQQIPIIVVTASKDEDSRIRALEIGVDDFLTKPVNRSELQARLRNHLKLKYYQDRLLRHQAELEDTVAERTRDLQKSYEKVRKASLETIQRLTRAAEYRDEETGDHIQRMSLMTVAVARSLNLDQKVIDRLLYATPMHDIGKIGIPDRILIKPGKLTPGEWQIMKQHTSIGAKILEGSHIGFLRLGEVIALTHHERWDGSGYPRGLSGRDIPLVGRIVAIADVFDALTSKRPYKEPFSLDRSVSIIRENTGSHFDPHIAEAFLSIIDEIEDIQKQYQQEGISPLYAMAEPGGVQTDTR